MKMSADFFSYNGDLECRSRSSKPTSKCRVQWCSVIMSSFERNRSENAGMEANVRAFLGKIT